MTLHQKCNVWLNLARGQKFSFGPSVFGTYGTIASPHFVVRFPNHGENLIFEFV